MLTLKDVPDELENRYKEYKQLCRQVFASCRHLGKTQRLPARTDLFEHTRYDAYVYVAEGYFKLYQQDKHLRFYSDSDFVATNGPSEVFRLVSDFGTDIVVFHRSDFLAHIRQDASLFEKWINLQEYENSINVSIYAFHIQHDVQAEFTFTNFEPGEIITWEGESPAGIYELISGSATVFHKNKEVGSINAGEIFGEISFLTERSRTATVKAEKRCIVRIVNKDDFFELIRTNPNLIISISKTLAHRIVQLNDKLVEVRI